MKRAPRTPEEIQWVHTLCAEKGMTHRMIADISGLSRGEVSRIARGGRGGPNVSAGPVRGERVAGAKITETDVQAIRILHGMGFKPAYIMQLFHISEQHVQDVVRRRRWRHVKPLPTP